MKKLALMAAAAMLISQGANAQLNRVGVESADKLNTPNMDTAVFSLCNGAKQNHVPCQFLTCNTREGGTRNLGVTVLDILNNTATCLSIRTWTTGASMFDRFTKLRAQLEGQIAKQEFFFRNWDERLEDAFGESLSDDEYIELISELIYGDKYNNQGSYVRRELFYLDDFCKEGIEGTPEAKLPTYACDGGNWRGDDDWACNYCLERMDKVEFISIPENIQYISWLYMNQEKLFGYIFEVRAKQANAPFVNTWNRALEAKRKECAVNGLSQQNFAAAVGKHARASLVELPLKSNGSYSRAEQDALAAAVMHNKMADGMLKKLSCDQIK